MPVVLNFCARRKLFNSFRCPALAWLGFFLLFSTCDMLAQRTLGTDISHFQPSPNWTTIKNAGVTFVWAKATEGDFYHDISLTNHMNNATNFGIFVGAYHFARPSDDPNITGANSADSEATYYWNTVNKFVKGGNKYLVPMLDWEDDHATNGHNGLTFTTTLMSQWVNEWCTTVSNLAKAQGVTVRPIVYTGTWYSNPLNGYAGLNTTVTNWYSWISSYNGADVQTGGPTASGGKNPTFPWPTWTVWQYSDTNWSGGDADVLKGVYTNLDALIIGGLPAPALGSQPVNDRAADIGGSVTFAAGAIGSAPLKYRWTLNGTNILNATNTTLMVTNIQLTNAGNYAVIVTNNSGSVTSTPVSLFVYPQQVTVFADNFDVNTATNWILNKSSSDTAVAFNFDYSTLGIPSAPNSTNGTTRGVQMKANLASGAVAALSLSPTNKAFAGDYRVHFDGWINVNGPLPGGPGSTEYLTAGIGTSGTQTEWTGNVLANGFYFSIDGDGGSGETQTTTADVNAYIGSTVQLASTGDYWAGTDVTSRGAFDPYYAAAFSNNAAPALQQANFPQQTGTLDDGTFGLAWHDVIVSKRGTTVDWVIDGIRFATISNATFAVSNVFIGFWDPFASLSSNNVINFGLVDNVRVESPAAAPVLTTQPAAKSVRLGTNVIFTAAATGLPSPNYQWKLNGTNIVGATNTSYVLAFVDATNAGNYSVVVTNFMGSTNSTNALLSIIAPAAAQFQTISAAGGTIQINFAGDAYWSYTIETSTNLLSWSSLTNLTSTNGLFNFTAGTTTDSPALFYRARVGP